MRLKSVKRTVAMALSAALVLTGLQMPVMGLELRADSDKQISGLGTGAIGKPDVPADTWAKWSGSYVWYGKYDSKYTMQTGEEWPGENEVMEPVKYRVLNPSETKFGGKTLFLDCDRTLYKSVFNISLNNEWKYSLIRNDLNGAAFLNKAGCFTDPEKEAIAYSTIAAHDLVAGTEPGKVDQDICEKYESYIALDKDRIFLMDAEDVSNSDYGYLTSDQEDSRTYATALQKDGLEYTIHDRFDPYKYWLRSALYPAAEQKDDVAIVDHAGDIIYQIATCDSTDYSQRLEPGVSPAFNVNLGSVIFASRIPDTEKEYKLTISDNNLKIGVKSGSKVTRNGSTVTVPYAITGSDAENATRVSVLILDKEYTPGMSATEGYTYLKLGVSKFATSGSGIFILPSAYENKEWGKDYFVYILAEDENEGKETDYASEPVLLNISSSADEPEDQKENQTLSFEKESVTLKVDETFKNILKGAKTAVTYASDKEDVASVDGEGNVKALKAGTATITATAAASDEYNAGTATYKVTVENKGGTDEPTDPDDPGSKDKVTGKVPPVGNEKYASSADNFAPLPNNNKINGMQLDFSKVKASGVKSSDLKMTAIKGSKFTTVKKVADASKVQMTGGVKVKVKKKTGIATIIVKKDGSATLPMEDGETYTINFKVDAPKGKKLTIPIGTAPVIKTLKELFGTDIDSGVLTATPKKNASKVTVSGNSLVIDPAGKDTIKVQYNYMNKKYKVNISVK